MLRYGNKADDDGGGMQCNHDSYCEIKGDSTILSNVAGGTGGAILITINSRVVVGHGTIKQNKAGSRAGGRASREKGSG